MARWRQEGLGRADVESGGPSITAQRVAAYRLGFTRAPAPYGDPAADEALAADVTGGQQAPAGRMRDYLAARTRFFDQNVVGGLRRGVDQVVIGAAGYDGRALRYAKPGVRWFEVDHPATQQDKRERLERLGLAAGQVRFVPADFTRDPIAERLLAAGLDPASPALFLLEGVAVYLERPVLQTVLSQFRQVAAVGGRLAISVSLSGDFDEAARARFQAWVASIGEPARSALDATEAVDLLARTGWQLLADGDPDGHEATAMTARRRSVGLLTASAGPMISAQPEAAAQSQAAAQPQPAAHPEAAAQPGMPEPAKSPRPQQSRPQGTLSLSALLSQVLVAFTIEFDNEAEHRLPHRTTNFGASSHGDGPWLVSLAMWETCMRFVGDEPITVRGLETFARTGTNLDGMRRWGYITIDGTASKSYKTRPGPNAVLGANAKGLRARQTWLPMAGIVEQRWLERFGAPVARLRDSLSELVRQLDPGLPDCLPILGANLLSRGPDPALPPRPAPADPSGLPLSALLSRVLLSFTLEYERGSSLSLATSANLLRVLDAEGTRPRDLPLLTGISKEAVSWALGVLSRAHLVAEVPDPAASRGKVARLTPRGLHAQGTYQEFLDAIEQQWQARYGQDAIRALRDALETLTASTDGEPPPVFRAIEPYPDNWRAMVRPPATLPYYPMVLHRGGYPDGS
jgi:methyltransferase (TIGR00027 family)